MRYMNHFKLYPLLGFKHGQHLPKLGNWIEHLVDGTWYRIDDAHNNGRCSKHRIKYQCHICSSWVPFGRRSQHESACARKFLCD